MGYTDCRAWDYSDHPQRARITQRCDHLVEAIRRRPKRFDRYGIDTRPGHRFLFSGMAPAACACIVGNYRGCSTCPALREYSVGLIDPSGRRVEPRVGLAAHKVAWHMEKFEKRCSKLQRNFDAWKSSGGQKASAHAVLLQMVQWLCELLDLFFRIHPYANGNGHAGRLFVWITLFRNGYDPVVWPIDGRPPYDQALTDYRDGNHGPLEALVLQSIIGPPIATQ